MYSQKTDISPTSKDLRRLEEREKKRHEQPLAINFTTSPTEFIGNEKFNYYNNKFDCYKSPFHWD